MELVVGALEAVVLGGLVVLGAELVVDELVLDVELVVVDVPGVSPSPSERSAKNSRPPMSSTITITSATIRPPRPPPDPDGGAAA